MGKIVITIEASKELYEVGDALASLVKSIKEKSKDGLTASEIALALTENLEKFLTGLAGVEQISEEVKANPQLAANASALIGAKILGSFLPEPKEQYDGPKSVA